MDIQICANYYLIMVQILKKEPTMIILLLSYNGHVKTYEALLNNGANINAKDNGNLSLLYCANKNGHKDVCKLLRERGADPI